MVDQSSLAFSNIKSFPGNRLRRVLLVLVAVWIGHLPHAAAAAEFGGIPFDDTVSLDGADLKLNGIGLRSVFILKAFLAALYVPQKSRDPAELVRQKGPRRLQMKMLVDMTPERLLKTFTTGINDNLSDSQVQALRPQLEQLNVALHAVGTAKKGDTLDLDLIDGNLRLALNGQPRGTLVPGEDFYPAILRAFLGDKPVEKDLKKGLLGG